MIIPRSQVLAAAILALLLSGCTTINGLLGEVDNTVLPGSREEAIPGRPTFPEKQDVAVGTAPSAQQGAAGKPAAQPVAPSDEAGAPVESHCAPDDPGCKPPETTGETFQDPQ